MFLCILRIRNMREVYSFVQMVSRAIRFMLSEIGKGILNALIFFRVLEAVLNLSCDDLG